jgi:hypothetical protein
MKQHGKQDTETKEETPDRQERAKTRDYLGPEGAVSGQGRAGGDLARDVATRDELKRSQDRPGSATRVQGGDKRAHGTEPEANDEGNEENKE